MYFKPCAWYSAGVRLGGKLCDFSISWRSFKGDPLKGMPSTSLELKGYMFIRMMMTLMTTMMMIMMMIMMMMMMMMMLTMMIIVKGVNLLLEDNDVRCLRALLTGHTLVALWKGMTLRASTIPLSLLFEVLQQFDCRCRQLGQACINFLAIPVAPIRS